MHMTLKYDDKNNCITDFICI